MIITEDWYPDEQLEQLSNAAASAKALRGLFIEFGCWEGKSTVTIADIIYPATLHAVDTWRGNINEDPKHVTVKTLKKRNVYATFRLNMQTDTKGNVEIHQMDCFDYLRSVAGPVAFCHIDASHNYEDVHRTISMCLPHMAGGGVLCGDDYVSAHKGRKDLNGGVERAVAELLPGHRVIGNFWRWRKDTQEE
ncbi:MAG TPA: class I SAM-dependent methyltransferase [Acidobacteriota bacterium]|nr:class I SAM-dependent methyltransferase [Acidobacteriota bacterium]